MTDLKSCYFCGALEGAEEDEAVPATLDPSAAVQQTVVLCPSCREKLTAVLEPVFEHDAAAEGAPAPETARPPGPGDEREDSPERQRSPDDGPADGAGASTGPGPDSEPPGDEAAETASLPEDYYTVLRFLENREFPVEREEVRAVVASAYDVEETAVEEILDAAVRREALVEADGTLARSRDQL